MTDMPEAPLAHLAPDNGKPEWEQINDLFAHFRLSAPEWRLRDQLVSHLMWARYGAEMHALQSAPPINPEEEKPANG